VRQRERGQAHRRVVVHFHDALEDRQVGERVEAAPHGDAGVVDHGVDAAECLERLADQPLEILGIGHVGGNGERVGAARAALLCHRLQPVAIARRQCKARATCRELQRQCATDALGGAGQDDPSSLHGWPSANIIG
jgi:hypothetical protein